MGLLVGYQGLAFALFSWARPARSSTGRSCRWSLLAPLVMVAIELGMPQIFPYYLAISQAFVPIVIQIADLTGPLGVTALMVALQRRAARCAGALRDARHAASPGRGAGRRRAR